MPQSFSTLLFASKAHSIKQQARPTSIVQWENAGTWYAPFLQLATKPAKPFYFQIVIKSLGIPAHRN
jgi:hypothetical protein